MVCVMYVWMHACKRRDRFVRVVCHACMYMFFCIMDSIDLRCVCVCAARRRGGARGGGARRVCRRDCRVSDPAGATRERAHEASLRNDGDPSAAAAGRPAAGGGNARHS